MTGAVRGRTIRSLIRRWIGPLLIIFAGCVAYSNSFEGVFLYDDLDSIRDNVHIRQLWPISEAVSWPLWGTAKTVDGRPVLSLSFALNHALLGPDPWGFHLVNLGIHILAALALFGIVRRTLCLAAFPGLAERSTALALAVSLIWLLHPVQTESVTYLVQRAESLMGLFYLTTLYCSIRGFLGPRRHAWYIGALIACWLGMGTKEVMVSAPILVLAYDAIFVSQSFAAAFRERRRFYLALAASWIVLAIPIASLFTVSSADEFRAYGPLAYFITQPGVLLYYLWLTVWPSPLSVHYNWPLAERALEIIPAALPIAAMLGLTIRGVVRRQWYGFLGLWFFAILGPTSSFIPLAQRIQEHRMYLPLAAVLVLIVLAADYLLQWLDGKSFFPRATTVGVSGLLVAALLLGMITYARNAEYGDAVVFWSSNIENRPGSSIAHNNLALALEKRNKLSPAVTHYRRALELDPRNVEAANNLGVTLKRQGRLDEAEESFNRALSINSKFSMADFNLGHLYEIQGRLAEAATHYSRVLAVAPNFQLAHNNLGVVFDRLGDLPTAEQHYRSALAIQPDYAEAHNNLGSLLVKRGKYRQAITEFEAALAINPSLSVARSNLNVLREQLDLRDD